MAGLFLKILNMSICAGYVVLGVVLLRPLLRRAPRWISVGLWALVAVRLVCPFTPESVLSLIPSGETVSPEIMTAPEPQIHTGFDTFNSVVNPVISQTLAPAPEDPLTPMEILVPILAAVWLVGVAGMLSYALISRLVLGRRVQEAVRLEGNLYGCAGIPSPFVLGLVKPRIYLPYGLEEATLPHVIAHERAHIRRRDHWWKPLGFLLLSIHWFNPLLWLGYVLLCRDIELACDEKVIRELGTGQRADYSQALLDCSIHPRHITACPLAFGEVGVKKRVKSILSYKKPALWLILLALVICAAAAVCLLTDPWDRDALGVRDLKVTGQGESFQIDISYSQIKGYAIRGVTSEDGEYTGDGVIAYDGSLGKYRMEITIGDASPSGDFPFSPGQVRELNSLLKLKTAWPDDSTLVIYIGSEYPMTFDEQEFTDVSPLSGHIRAKLSLDISVTNLPGGKVVEWFDFHRDGTLDWDKSFTVTPEGLPGYSFRWEYGNIQVLRDGTATTVVNGMPVWNAFFTDLTGDGFPELCVSCSFGSGMIDEHIIIEDVMNGSSYTLWERGEYDYLLKLENGVLQCLRAPYPVRGWQDATVGTPAISDSGAPVMLDGDGNIIAVGSVMN